MVVFGLGCVEGPPTLPSNISFQKMSRKKEIPFFYKKKCKGFKSLGGGHYYKPSITSFKI
jgi:hypothetical protein